MNAVGTVEKRKHGGFTPTPERAVRKSQKDSAARLVRGFTVIELLVVTAVMLLLSSITLVYSTSMRGSISLDVESAKIGQVIARAKSLALATYNSPAGSPCAYGVSMYYASQTYTLFGYTDPTPNRCKTLGATGIDHDLNRTLIESYTTNPDLILDEPATAIDVFYDVLFVPPDPTIYVTNGSTGNLGDVLPIGGIAKIYLKTKSGGITRQVSVSTVGQISF